LLHPRPPAGPNPGGPRYAARFGVGPGGGSAVSNTLTRTTPGNVFTAA